MTWRPEWLLVALTCAVLALLLVLTVRGWRSSAPWARAASVGRVVVALGLVLVSLRPSGEQEVERPEQHDLDMVVMLDRTASMGALDHRGGSRMEGAAEDLVEVVAGAAGAHVTVIVFDDTARVLVPATTDVNSVVTTLRTVGWRPWANATGSDISIGTELAREILAKVSEERPSSRRMLLYAGDGEQTQESQRSSFAPVAGLADEAWVLGYGTEAGGVMPVAPGETALVKLDGEPVRSTLDPRNLQAVADELGGTYVDRAASGPLPDAARAGPASVREVVPGAEHYWVVALALVPVLLVLLVLAVRRWRDVQEDL